MSASSEAPKGEMLLDPPSWWRQFKILMKKNFLLKRRNLRMSILEVLFPLYWVGILVALKYGLGGTATGPTIVPSVWDVSFVSISDVCGNWTQINPSGSKCVDVGYAPVGEPYDSIMYDLYSHYSPKLSIAGFNSSDLLVQFYLENPMSLASGVIFNTNDGLSYTIRMNSSIFPAQVASDFLMSGYADLDTALQQSILNVNKAVNESRIWIDLSASRMALEIDSNLFKTILPLYFPFIFAYSIAQLVIFVVTEKSQKIREHLRMAGMKDSPYWISWMVTQMIIVCISTALFEGLLYATGILAHTNFVLVFMIFAGYAFSLLALGLILVTFLDTPKTAGAFAALAQVITTAIMAGAHYLVFSRPNGSPAQQLLGLVNTVPLGEFMSAASNAEAAGYSLSFNDQWYWIAWLYGDAFLYTLIAWYLSNIIAGDYGPARPFYFLFTRTYWCPPKIYRSSEPLSPATRLLRDPIDGDSLDGKAGIEIVDLRKEFGRPSKTRRIFTKCCSTNRSKPRNVPSSNIQESESSSIIDDGDANDLEEDDGRTVAVDGLNLSIHPGEIFALLGHNGAGKSTTIKIITGSLSPSSGTVYINGYDIASYAEEIRRRMGVCDQADVLFESLTPAEHLRLFGAMKGIPDSILEKEIDSKLAEVMLTDHRDKEVSALSGGMKRKLCTAIAFLGDPKVVLLDECTAGMDPCAYYGPESIFFAHVSSYHYKLLGRLDSRSKIWEMLQNYKGKTSIIMTTHFMEEADSLGDRICIMTAGAVKALGTNVELKNKFGVGYQLTVLKDEKFDQRGLETWLHQALPASRGAVLPLADNLAELSYQVPFSHVPAFPKFIKELRHRSSEFGIKTFVLQPTTLEEVFLKLAQEDENE